MGDRSGESESGPAPKRNYSDVIQQAKHGRGTPGLRLRRRPDETGPSLRGGAESQRELVEFRAGNFRDGQEVQAAFGPAFRVIAIAAGWLPGERVRRPDEQVDY